MKRSAAVLAGAVVVALGACSSPVGNSPAQCASGQRVYNGICRALCSTSVACPAQTRCTQVDSDASLCLDKESAANCAYLESDTKCYGEGSYYHAYGRGSYEYAHYQSDPPSATSSGLTPYADSNFAASDPGTAPYLDMDGCAGDSQWKTVAASTDPACTATHNVVRCRRFGSACKLIPGTTRETASP